MKDWLKYRDERRTPTIVAPSGNLSNHHYTKDGLIGERVKLEDATHIIVTVTTVEPA